MCPDITQTATRHSVSSLTNNIGYESHFCGENQDDDVIYEEIADEPIGLRHNAVYGGGLQDFSAVM